jgi:hypothetical protein
MRFVVSSEDKKLEEDPGILYLVLFELDGKSLVKIGVTTRAIEDRVSEILVSIFKVYREFPYCRPKRFRKTTNIFEKETLLHNYFREYCYKPEKTFSGSSEFFDIPLDEAVIAYEHLMAGGSLDESGLRDVSNS